MNSTTFGTFALILYEESGEHFSFSFPPISMSDYLCRVRHTQSCQTFCGYEKVWPNQEESNMADSSLPPISEAIFPPRHSPVSSSRTCKYHWFLFSSFYFLLQSCLYLISPSSCQWSSLSLCIFVNKFLFFTIQNVNTAKKKKISLLLMFVDDLSLSFSFLWSSENYKVAVNDISCSALCGTIWLLNEYFKGSVPKRSFSGWKI